MSAAPSSWLPRALALTLLAATLPRAAQARTGVIGTQLDYAAVPGCPALDGFEAIVTRRLGYDTFRPDAPNRVMVRIESVGRGLEGRLEWLNEAGGSIGEQTFPSRTGDCAELARAMGFALALQIQLLAASVAEAAAEPPPAPATEPVAPPPQQKPPPSVLPAPPIELEAPAAPPSAAGPGPAVLVGAGALAGLGLPAEPMAIGRLFVTAAWPRAALELGVEASVPSTTRRSDGAGFSQEEFLGSLAACGVRAPWNLCAVGKLGELRVSGQSVDVPLTAAGLTAQTGLRLAFMQEVGRRAYVYVLAEGLARLTQGTVTLDNVPLWTTPRFAALLGINFSLRIH